MPPLQDTITLFPSTSPSVLSKPRTLIFLITGNPGLIEYYRPFLTSLQHDLGPDHNLVLHGVSLPGFELHSSSSSQDLHPPPSQPPNFNLRETIDATKRALLTAVAEYGVTNAPVAGFPAPADPENPGDPEDRGRRDGPVRVILMGHSVGAYVLLEVAEWWGKVRAGEAGPKRGVNGSMGASGSAMRIVGGICLFPTVVEIGASSRGLVVTPLLYIPRLAALISTLTKLVFLFVPSFVLTLLLSVLLMERPAADISAAWLKSKNGVRQTVFLARYEMEEIGADRWSTDLWGSQTIGYATESAMMANAKGQRPRLYFLWAEHDHWVNNVQRDRLIARRTSLLGQSEEGAPWMEIDNTGLPHAFCVTHKNSTYVAGKVATWIREMI